MATRGKNAVSATIRAMPVDEQTTALAVAVGLLTGANQPRQGWANSQSVSWRLPVQSLAQIDVLAEAANISRSRAALTIMNAGWMQMMAALPSRAQRERFQAAMASAAEERLKTGKTEVVLF
jgi:hypothetical protein